MINNILNLMYSAAMESFSNGEVPVAAVIVNNKTKEVVSVKGNNRQSSHSVIGHAEILSILDVESVIGDWRLDGYDLYVSLEPCHMCIEVINESRLDNVFYICDGKYGNDLPSNFYKLDVSQDIYNKFSELLTSFFNNMR